MKPAIRKPLDADATPPVVPPTRLCLFDPSDRNAATPSPVDETPSPVDETKLLGERRPVERPSILEPCMLPDASTQSYWSHKPHVKRKNFAAVDSWIRERSLEQFGSFSIAYSLAVQPRIERFGDERGFIAFGRRGGVTFVLGDPMASESDRETLLDDFLKRFRSPSFVSVQRSTAELLQTRGFFVNEMGVDTRVDLNTFHFNGKKREWLRYADNWVTRRGFVIREFSFETDRDQVERVSESWRATRTVRKKEVRFLNRPIVMQDEPNVRRFGLFDDQGTLSAFVIFDPLFHGGQLIGYVTCIKRRTPDCNGYAESAILKRAIEVFQHENIPSLWLGLSPLANLVDVEFRANRLMHRICNYYYNAGWFNRWFYNFRGHSEFKRRFGGEEHRVYYASRVRINTYRFLNFASLCGVF
jgi:phosphatidylglycerol lysyltransferase